jgi:hypothetical protein
LFIISDERGGFVGSQPMGRKDEKRLKTSAERERTARLQVILPTDEVAAVDEFRYRARMLSRAAAVRELLRRGLASFDTDRPPESN